MRKRKFELLKFTPPPRRSAHAVRVAEKIDVLPSSKREFVEGVIDEMIERKRNASAQLTRMRERALELLSQMPREERRRFVTDFTIAALGSEPQEVA